MSDINFKNKNEEILFVQAKLGIEAERFLKSQLGQFVLGAAKDDREDALNKLAKVSSFRKNRIQQLQNQAEVPGMAIQWLLDAIALGQQAEIQLKEES